LELSGYNGKTDFMIVDEIRQQGSKHNQTKQYEIAQKPYKSRLYPILIKGKKTLYFPAYGACGVMFTVSKEGQLNRRCIDGNSKEGWHTYEC
jgi:hypothetical protein